MGYLDQQSLQALGEWASQEGNFVIDSDILLHDTANEHMNRWERHWDEEQVRRLFLSELTVGAIVGVVLSPPGRNNHFTGTVIEITSRYIVCEAPLIPEVTIRFDRWSGFTQGLGGWLSEYLPR